MRIGTLRSAQDDQSTPVPWKHVWALPDGRHVVTLVEARPSVDPGALDATVMVHLRPVPPGVERELRRKHGETHLRYQFGRGLGLGRGAGSVGIDTEAQQRVADEMLLYAFRDLTIVAPSPQAATLEIRDEVMASRINAALRNGRVKAGEDLDLTGLLRENDALRRLVLLETPGLREFVDAEAERLTREAVADEVGKGETSSNGPSSTPST